MLKNPLYKYGSGDLKIPQHLNFGQFLLDKLVKFKYNSFVNGITGETSSFGEIAQQSMNVAISLSKLGVGKGLTVAVCSESRKEFWSAVVGSICTGATVTTFNTVYTKHELLHVANISKPNYLICSPLAYEKHKEIFRSLKFIKKIIIFGNEKLAGIIPYYDLVSVHNIRFEDFKATDVDGSSDPVFVLYSSGTTGLPKGVIITHYNCLVYCCFERITSSISARILMVVPWFLAMGVLSFSMFVADGADIIYMPKFDVEPYQKCIEDYKITTLHVVPAMLIALSKQPSKYDVSSVNIILAGAAPLSKGVFEAVKTKFPNIVKVIQGYGLTEACCVTQEQDYYNSLDTKIGTVGTVMPATTVKVVDLKTQKPVGANHPGEICIKGGIITKKYVGRDEKDCFDDEGFFRTGDIGYFDEDGYFFIVDRVKDLIKYKGYQVAPAEIEAVLLKHPAIQDVGVVGVPDADAGEVPRAYVTLQPGASTTVEELKKFVEEQLSNPKKLRGGVYVVRELPRNSSGKMLRRQLLSLTQDKSKL